ncbi:IS3 family transposase [Bradyrhizobium diazoefficiens]|nr:IS3 family transposase [Bradyrhizobium diazoefficiens]
MQAQGRGVSRGRIERLMHRHGIRAIMAPPRHVRTTDSRHGLPIAPNLIRPSLCSCGSEPDLACRYHLHSDGRGLALLGRRYGPLQPQNRRLGDRDHMQVELVSSALTMAIRQQRPEPGLIHHSDRGVQYASQDYRAVLSATGITASMSRKADCYDNAPMESFFHTLKTELVHHRNYQTRAEAQRDLFAYIEGFYNRIRLHSAIGYIAPIQMELKAA